MKWSCKMNKEKRASSKSSNSAIFNNGSKWLKMDLHLHTDSDKSFHYPGSNFIQDYVDAAKPEIVSKKLMQILEKNASTDPLTGLSNRKFLETFLDTSIYEGKYKKVPCGLMMVDIDFFKLIRGALTVVKGGKKIAELTEPGEYFGEMAAISGEQRAASIISQGRSTVKRFPGDKLEEVIKKYPEVSEHLFKTIVTRLQKSNQIIVKLAGGGGRPPVPPRPA